MNFNKNIYNIFSEEEIYFIAKYIDEIDTKAEILSAINAFDFSLLSNLRIDKNIIEHKLLSIRKDIFIDLVSYVENFRSISV